MTPQEEQVARLQTAIFNFLSSRHGSPLASRCENVGTESEPNWKIHEGFSDDAASLYTLVYFPNGETSLVKVGWGEFAPYIFTNPEKAKYPKPAAPYSILSKTIPLYCVGQKDSYFATDAQQNQMKLNPGQYLAEHSIFFCVPPGNFIVVPVDKNTLRRTVIEEKNIRTVSYDFAIQTIRGLAFEGPLATKKEFCFSVLKKLPDDPGAANTSLTGDARTILLGDDFLENTGLTYSNEFAGKAYAMKEPVLIKRLIELKHQLGLGNTSTQELDMELSPGI